MTFEDAVKFLFDNKGKSFVFIEDNYKIASRGPAAYISYSSTGYNDEEIRYYSDEEYSVSDNWSIELVPEPKIFLYDSSPGEQYFHMGNKMGSAEVVDFTIKYGSFPFECLLEYFEERQLFWRF